jgi:hypothetical protein
LGRGGPALGGNTFEWRVFGKCGEVTPQICQARNFGAMITAAQCRSARTLLSWSLSKLASAASVPINVIESASTSNATGTRKMRPDEPLLVRS